MVGLTLGVHTHSYATRLQSTAKCKRRGALGPEVEYGSS